MFEYRLLFCFIFISIFALIIILRPLQKTEENDDFFSDGADEQFPILRLRGLNYKQIIGSRKKLYLIAFFFLVIVSMSYWMFGGWLKELNYKEHIAEQERVEGLLKSVKGPQDLIDKLQNHLFKHPNGAKGWYLLGRLYASQSQWYLSRKSFAKAHTLKPDNELFGVNYAQSLFDAHKSSSDKEARLLLNKIIKKNPIYPDALSMLAMDSYIGRDYKKAINYWQRLLALLPDKSEEALAIRKAIAKAQGFLDSK